MNTFKLVEPEKTTPCFSLSKTWKQQQVSVGKRRKKSFRSKSTNKFADVPRHQGLPPIAPEPLPSAPPQATTESKRSAGGFDDLALVGGFLMMWLWQNFTKTWVFSKKSSMFNEFMIQDDVFPFKTESCFCLVWVLIFFWCFFKLSLWDIYLVW